MIRHRPHGTGHPYQPSPDQRLPVQPEAGQPVTLGVTTSPDVTEVTCHWQTNRAGQPSIDSTITMRQGTPGAANDTPGSGHLAAAQAGPHTQRITWTASTPPLDADTAYRYWFTGTTDNGASHRTATFDLTAATWTDKPAGATLRIDTDRLIPGSVHWRQTSSGLDRLSFALRLNPDEHVVGFGERFDRLDQRGHRLDATVFEQYKDQAAHGRTYLPMPFAHVVSASGSWGFHIRTANRTHYDVAATHPDELRIQVDLDGRPTQDIDVGIYHGTPTDVLDQFLAEVGRPEELPDWIFRLWASGNEWNTQRLVLDRMNTHRDLDIPVGVVVIEAWSDESTFTAFRDAHYHVTPDGAPHDGDDFTYPPGGAWPDPKGLVDELHRRGIKVVLWQIPLLKMRPPPQGQARADADALLAGGHAVQHADGRPYRNHGWWFPGALMPDLSTQCTRQWWTDKRRYLVRHLGVDGFKTDGGEHAWGDDLTYRDGTLGVAGNNRFPVHYARAYGDLLRSEAKAPVTFSRAGFTGSQAHGIYWAGDENSTWEAFRASITAGLTAAACGILYWGWDIAGFSGPIPDAELYLRATAAATFMPIMQYHSEYHHHRKPLRDRTPWNIQQQTGNENVVSTFRRFTQIREALIPYLAQQTKASTATGKPLMRPLYFDHSDDPTVWNHPLQYKLGDHLLINPVTEPGATKWTTYLPAGDWIDTTTGEHLPGARAHTRPAPLNQIPTYASTTAWPQLSATFPQQAMRRFRGAERDCLNNGGWGPA